MPIRALRELLHRALRAHISFAPPSAMTKNFTAVKDYPIGVEMAYVVLTCPRIPNAHSVAVQGYTENVGRFVIVIDFMIGPELYKKFHLFYTGTLLDRPMSATQLQLWYRGRQGSDATTAEEPHIVAALLNILNILITVSEASVANSTPKSFVVAKHICEQMQKRH